MAGYRHIGCNLGERAQHEIAVVHARMRHRQIGGADGRVAEDEQIDIECSGGVLRAAPNPSVGRLNARGRSPQLMA